MRLLKMLLLAIPLLLSVPASTENAPAPRVPITKNCPDGSVVAYAKRCPTPKPPAPNWTKCADENGLCRIVGTAAVRYGFGDRWATKTVTSQVACNNAVFGDPIPGTVKRCETSGQVASAAPPPPPPPPPFPTDGAVTLNGAADIADNFETLAGLKPYTGPYPPSEDAVGAFRFGCSAGQLLYDDPIVYPGKPGKSHLHQFYGNTGANAMSDYKSLRETGGTTCGDSAAPVNRSGYWMPAMLDGAGNAVRPDYVDVYYKRLPKSDPRCSRSSPASVQPMGDCVGMPNGIRFILGFDMKSMTMPDTSGHFVCQGPTAVLGNGSQKIADIIPRCPIGNQLVAKISFPECWDGKNLDSADHRSHVANTKPWPVSPWHQRCPDTHPYVLPKIDIHAFYTVDANFLAGKWHLSSDKMPGMEMAAGSTIHMDYFEAWSPVVKKMWQDGCIDKHFTCAGGPLGNPWMIKNSETGYLPRPNPRLVPVM